MKLIQMARAAMRPSPLPKPKPMPIQLPFQSITKGAAGISDYQIGAHVQDVMIFGVQGTANIYLPQPICGVHIYLRFSISPTCVVNLIPQSGKIINLSASYRLVTGFVGEQWKSCVLIPVTGIDGVPTGEWRISPVGHVTPIAQVTADVTVPAGGYVRCSIALDVLDWVSNGSVESNRIKGQDNGCFNMEGVLRSSSPVAVGAPLALIATNAAAVDDILASGSANSAGLGVGESFGFVTPTFQATSAYELSAFVFNGDSDQRVFHGTIKLFKRY